MTTDRFAQWMGPRCAACASRVPPDRVLSITPDGHAIVQGSYGRAFACSPAGGFHYAV